MKTIGELLLIILLLITNGRIFFIKHPKHDSIVILAPICLSLSVLQFFAWGFEVTTAGTFILALIVFLSNFHAMFRYSEKLYIDHYSPLMYFWSILTVLLSVLFLAETIFFLPMELQDSKIGVVQTKLNYEGGFRTGFTQSRFAANPELTIYKFEKAPEPSPHFKDDEITETESELEINQPAESEIKKIIIFFPDKTADTFYYKPYLQYLAKEDFTVYSGDFYSKDCRWMHSIADSKLMRRTVMSFEKLLSNQKFIQQKEFYNYNISLECKEMLSLVHAEELNARKESQIFQYYLIGDEMSSTALKDFYYSQKNSFEAKNPDALLGGYFLINDIDAYKTPGFGCITQTDPLLATLLNVDRDYSLSDTQQMVQETKTYLTKE